MGTAWEVMLNARTAGTIKLRIKKRLMVCPSSKSSKSIKKEFALVCQEQSGHRILWLQLACLKWGPRPSKGVNTDTVMGFGIDLGRAVP
jgi:hypothetical protein